MDNDQRELYERGAADAAHNDLNLFYYQHYYYYRKGYDDLRRSQARSSRRLLVLLSSGLLIVVAVVLYLAPQWSSTAPPAPVAQSALPPAPANLPTVPPAAPPVAEPNPEPPVSPADAPIINADVLQPVPVSLKTGMQAIVINVDDAPLRLRQTASLEADVVVRLDEGTLVSIIGGPVEADGYIWWELEHATGRGWGAERSLDGLPWLAVVP